MRLIQVQVHLIAWPFALIAYLVTMVALGLRRLRRVAMPATVSLAFLGTAANGATTWFVIGTGGSDSNLGTSWGQGLLTIQEGLSRASAGDQVWVKAGTYTLTSATDTYLLTDGAWLLGGFAGNETDRKQADPYTNLTILDGNNNAQHVVTAINPIFVDQMYLTRLDGFNIEHGDASEATITEGGGLLVIGDAASTQIILAVSRCKFDNNQAVSGGAVAVDASNGTSVTTLTVQLTNCEFIDNSAGNGGAVALFRDSAFAQSQLNVVFTNCEFIGNAATYGGAIALDETCSDHPDECSARMCTTLPCGTVSLLKKATMMFERGSQSSKLIPSRQITIVPVTLFNRTTITMGSSLDRRGASLGTAQRSDVHRSPTAAAR